MKNNNFLELIMLDGKTGNKQQKQLFFTIDILEPSSCQILLNFQFVVQTSKRV